MSHNNRHMLLRMLQSVSRCFPQPIRQTHRIVRITEDYAPAQHHNIENEYPRHCTDPDIGHEVSFLLLSPSP